MMTISVIINKKFCLKAERPTRKYSPVSVTDPQTGGERQEFEGAKTSRKKACLAAYLDKDPKDVNEREKIKYKITPGAKTYVPKPDDVPVVVISSGSADKLRLYFSAAISATHPQLGWDLRVDQSVGGKKMPIVVFVHETELEKYEKALEGPFEGGNACYFVGWSAGGLAGFGATRAAVLQYATGKAPVLRRIIVMDQDVLFTAKTDFRDDKVIKKIEALHDGQVTNRKDLSKPYYEQYEDGETGLRVIGFGIGYPTRGQADKTLAIHKDSAKLKGVDDVEQRQSIIAQTLQAMESPTQQYVSINVGGLEVDDDIVETIYPFYMVAGGEDMVMTVKEQPVKVDPPKLSSDGKPLAAINSALRKQEIKKFEIPGEFDKENKYEEMKAKFLETLAGMEGNRMLNAVPPSDSQAAEVIASMSKEYGIPSGSTDVKTLSSKLMAMVCEQDGRKTSPNEQWRISACIIERILIARLNFEKARKLAAT